MQTPPHTDTLILGAGLAGVLVTEALLDVGVASHNITLLDAGLERASSSPGALMHAIPGRTLVPKEGTLQAFIESVAWLERQRERHPALVSRADMTRPDFGTKQGRRYVNTYERARATYPDLLANELIDASDCASHLPAMQPANRGVRYGPAYCVMLEGLLDAIEGDLIARGITRTSAFCKEIERVDDHWVARDREDRVILTAARVVLCPGAQITRWFPSLPLAINGGELIVATPPTADVLHGFLSGGGHVAFRPDGKWVYGATYLRPPDDATDPHAPEHFERSDAVATEAVHALIERLVPRIRQARDVEVWRGRRAVFLTDRQPLAGPVPEQPDLYLLGALGSKGLLWTPSLARVIADMLQGNMSSDTRPVHAMRARCARASKDLERWRSPIIRSREV